MRRRVILFEETGSGIATIHSSVLKTRLLSKTISSKNHISNKHVIK